MSEKPTEINGVAVPYGASEAEISEMIESDGPGRWAAFAALGHSDTQETLDQLLAHLDSDESQICRAALEGLGIHAKGAEGEEEILTCLSDLEGSVVRQACHVVGVFGFQAAHDVMVRLVSNESEATQCSALDALSAIWLPADTDLLLKLCNSPSATVVLRTAARVLRQHVTPANVEKLFHLWYDDVFPKHRTWACELAAENDIAGADNALESLVDDDNKHVRKAAEAAIETRKTRTP